MLAIFYYILYLKYKYNYIGYIKILHEYLVIEPLLCATLNVQMVVKHIFVHRQNCTKAKNELHIPKIICETFMDVNKLISK